MQESRDHWPECVPGECTDCSLEGSATEVRGGDRIRVKGMVKATNSVSVKFDTSSSWFTFYRASGRAVVNSFGDGGKKSDKDERRAARRADPKPSSRDLSPGRKVEMTVGTISAGRQVDISSNSTIVNKF